MENPESRIRRAWQGRISGCQLGKPLEFLSIQSGHDALQQYLADTGSLPLRDYVPWRQHVHVRREWCRESMQRSEPDDDINYTFLALLLLEEHGLDLTTTDVARSWLNRLPAGSTFTAERAAYRTLLHRGNEWFANGAEAGFDLRDCSDNPCNDWIGAQIRTDLYGWVCPGNPDLAAVLAERDAALSHRDAGVHGAIFIAALGAALATGSAEEALATALEYVPEDSSTHNAIQFGLELAGNENGGAKIRKHYQELSPVHALNNLAIVIWALYSHLDDFSAAIGDAVSAGLDTDCNGATVGGLWGLQGGEIPDHWTRPWQGRVGLGLAGYDEISLDELVHRTMLVSGKLAR